MNLAHLKKLNTNDNKSDDEIENTNVVDNLNVEFAAKIYVSIWGCW